MNAREFFKSKSKEDILEWMQGQPIELLQHCLKEQPKTAPKPASRPVPAPRRPAPKPASRPVPAPRPSTPKPAPRRRSSTPKPKASKRFVVVQGQKFSVKKNDKGEDVYVNSSGKTRRVGKNQKVQTE